MGLAYLLARAADTVADTDLVARPERIAHLETLRRACAGDDVDVAGVARAAAPLQTHEGERRLLGALGPALARVAALPPADRREVRAVLDTLTSGMLFDLRRFPGRDASSLAALDTLEELDRYVYLVAGCVGPFWTALHVAHRPALRGWDLEALQPTAIRFGKALQMTNVLRDVPRDLRAGRCYLPASELRALGLAPTDLLDPGRTPRARPLLERLLRLTLDHYQAAWQYTLAIPPREWRMRLPCAWPLMIGLATLARVAPELDRLAVTGPIKIPRREVRAILARSLLTVWSNRRLRVHATRLLTRVRA